MCRTLWKNGFLLAFVIGILQCLETCDDFSSWLMVNRYVAGIDECK